MSGVVDQEEFDDMGEPAKCDHDIFDQKKSASNSSNRKQSLPSRWRRDRYLNLSRCIAKTNTVEDESIRAVGNAVCKVYPKNYHEAMMIDGNTDG